ncbi:MAG: flagellar hook protein FlgE [Aestuariivirga sp.]|uniref:flagellar hook protein FlgE n=1 Tax=Aestuariivirga sp. TaxID=2650926 RepID=UPI0025C15355|nr:flagellar hook protein FlgE [Aestuariivirga sp.]MCA3561398.1 flagellar hook protein FlgE [Aestuariivirga sp.]
MSLYGVMRTGVSGMNAQANRLSTVADNVANVNTTGYKSSSCEFSSLILSNWDSAFESGAVLTDVRHNIDAQGGLVGTSSVSDLAIRGGGFFMVANPAGTPYLTRAGAFVPDDSGTLVNAAGFALLGYKLNPGQPAVTLNGFNNLTPVSFGGPSLSATPSSQGAIRANLPSTAGIIAVSNLPSFNNASSTYTAKSSLIVYDNLGAEVNLDIYFAKTGAGNWEMSVYDSRDAASNGGFPYSTGPLTTQTLAFGADGRLDPSQPSSFTFTIPGGADFTLGVGGTTQFATGYTVLSASVNGTPAGAPKNVEISRDGFVYAIYDGGTRIPVFRIPLAHVTSPNLLTPLAGNVFQASSETGGISVGFAQSAGLGDIMSKTLEQSTVDLASELTTMIDAQRAYTANSKVFQTGSELMDVLVNLKR